MTECESVLCRFPSVPLDNHLPERLCLYHRIDTVPTRIYTLVSWWRPSHDSGDINHGKPALLHHLHFLLLLCWKEGTVPQDM